MWDNQGAPWSYWQQQQGGMCPHVPAPAQTPQQPRPLPRFTTRNHSGDPKAGETEDKPPEVHSTETKGEEEDITLTTTAKARIRTQARQNQNPTQTESEHNPDRIRTQPRQNQNTTQTESEPKTDRIRTEPREMKGDEGANK